MPDRLDTLNEIVATLKAGEQSYRDAAEKVESGELSRLCQSHAEMRAVAASELASTVEAAGGEPASPSMTERARGLVTRVAAMVGDTDQSYVSHLEEHEDRTLKAYDEALQNDALAGDRELLERQRQKFAGTHEAVRTLKKAA